MPIPDKFRFRKNDTIGAADADDDGAFLSQCFVDTGDLDSLRDCSNPRRVVLGRTGAGKTALLARLQEVEGRVICMRPESLALPYISNSSILTFVWQLGVKLDIFFRLLWRHVFAVELIRTHFHIRNEEDKASFVTRFSNLFRDRKYSQCLQYLEDYGQQFWEETDYRIKEVTTKLEDSIKASLTRIIHES
jgi:hypothetical protein